MDYNTVVMAEAAQAWFRFGFPVIPIVPGEKRPTLKRHPWIDELSPDAITKHWEKSPKHEVAIIVPEGFVVLDADSPKAINTLKNIEASHNVTPNMVVQTTRGVHHYYRLDEKVYAPSDTHDSEKHPNRIDVLGCGRQVIIPPSTGKSLRVRNAKSAKDLVAVDQNFIDSVFLMNDRQVPRPPDPEKISRVKPKAGNTSVGKLEALLDSLDPDCGYEDWLNILMAVFHETGGSEEGFVLVDSWSQRSNKYKGRQEIETKWRSFKPDTEKRITIGTLIKMAKDAGADVSQVLETEFEICETIVVQPQKETVEVVKSEVTVFDKYSLTGRSAELEKNAAEQVTVLGEIALLGQLTVLCAEGNTGKTLIAQKLLTESIEAKRIDPAKVYYLNMDDDYRGIVEKLKIAEEFGYNMLAEGYQDFKAKDFLDHIRDLIRKNKARGVIVFLDTLKKFVDLMKKSECRDFNTVLRQFSAYGGTVIALAHTNKNKGSDGRPVFSGTGDLKDDFDCMYTLRLISEREAKEKVVLFEKEKARGSVVEKASYSYINDKTTSYSEMFLSVQAVDENQIASLQQAEEIRSDAEIIDAVIACIEKGVNTKMKLSKAAAELSGASKRSVLQIINKYTGDDPAAHRWFYVRGARGKQTFTVLNMDSEENK